MAMTNAQIVFLESQKLLEDGKIKPTGRTFEAVDGEGNTITYQEPEAIHTYQVWKELGFQVQRGQKAVAQFSIWKHTVKKDKETGETKDEKMFLQKASWFSRSQVEPIKK